MLRTENGETEKLKVHGFLIGIEMQEGVDVNALVNEFADFLMEREGIGALEVEHLGEIEVLEGTEEPPLQMLMAEQGELPFKES